MDDIDEKIIKKINTNQNVPVGFTQSIQKALYKDVKIKNKVVEFTKILATACTTIAIAGGVSFAGYGLYQKIWKDPERISIEQAKQQLDEESQIQNITEEQAKEIAEQKLDLPVIMGITTPQEQVVAGNRLNDEDLEKLETVIQIMNICKSYELDKKVSSIDITNKNDYIMYMEEEKKTIHLGSDSNLTNKMLYVPSILKENQGKEGTIYLNGNINGDFKPRFREKV